MQTLGCPKELQEITELLCYIIHTKYHQQWENLPQIREFLNNSFWYCVSTHSYHHPEMKEEHHQSHHQLSVGCRTSRRPHRRLPSMSSWASQCCGGSLGALGNVRGYHEHRARNDREICPCDLAVHGPARRMQKVDFVNIVLRVQVGQKLPATLGGLRSHLVF